MKTSVSIVASLLFAFSSLGWAAESVITVPNAGFEQKGEGWKADQDNGMSTFVPEAAHTGKLGLRVTDASATLGSNLMSPRFPATAGKSYEVRFYGRKPDGKYFDSHDSGHGGWGACATHDGAGPFRTMAHGDTRIIPLELQESALPARIEEFALRADSGGAGKFRGGLGFRKVYRMLDACQLQTNLDRTKFPPWGAQGGREGAPGRFSITREGAGRAIGKEKGLELRPGDLVTVETGGGGGYGSPRERSLAAIQRDIDAGYVSRARAMIDYDVTIDEQGRVAYSPEGNATSEASRARGSDV